MNERILELAKHCGYWSGQTIEMNDVGVETFVKLIVRECVSKCEIVADMAEITNTGEMARKTKATADSCARMIRQHFGVE